MSQDQMKAKPITPPQVGAMSASQSEQIDASALISKLEGKVKVVHGANDDELEMVGQKVGDVRRSLKDAFNIPDDAMALVDGEQVDNDYVLQSNSVLEFIKQAGVKGKTPFFILN